MTIFNKTELPPKVLNIHAKFFYLSFTSYSSNTLNDDFKVVKENDP